MNHLVARLAFLAASIALLLASLFMVTLAHAQSWEYFAYNDSGLTGKGYIKLTESDGGHRVQVLAGRIDACFRAPLKASLESSETTLTITPKFDVNGCPPVRYVIKKDGSGGIREVQREGQWVHDGRDRSLKTLP